MAGIIIDLVIVAVIAICVLLGYHKGLTGSLLKIVSFVAALVIAFVLFKPISNLVIEKTNWDENLEQSIREMVLKQEEQPSEKTEEEKDMPSVITNYINQTVENAANETKQAVVDNTARNVSVTIINAGTWIALFLIARIALLLVKGLAELLTSLPIIKQVDKTGGVIYGLLEALVILYVLLALLSFISPMIDADKNVVAQGVQSSWIGSYLYNNNLLLKIIF